ncbi:SDR family NAD(P)-dependent oxidoreductase [Actinomadura rugatobispora]|uniref:SDR family NAD(P)-dependent oxidoreductase n=1 Tax=Actinomadura rugatobispora TaxID=1994 RepID=A0ABW0ZWJ6_9ACTN
MNEFEGKIALVVGASVPGNMGDVTARTLADKGATVVVSGLGREPLEALARDIGGYAVEADITRQDDTQRLVAAVIERYGRLDIAANFVGVADRVLIRDITPEHLERMTSINYHGTVWFIQSVADKIVDGGAIVTTSSLGAYDALVGVAGYVSAKRAADRFLQAAAIEYRDKRLRINSVIPTANDTPMLRKGIEQYGVAFEDHMKAFIDLTPLSRSSTAQDIAWLVCVMLRDEFFETGQSWHYGGGNSLLGHPRSLG